MRYSVLFIALFGCSQDKSIQQFDHGDSIDSGNGTIIDENDDRLIGDSNVFLDDPEEELNAILDSDDWDDTSVGIPEEDYDGYSGVLVQQQSNLLEVIHFGLMLPCDWDSSAIDVGYYTENIAEPYTGAMMVDYGPEGECPDNLSYVIDLTPLAGAFSPGLHVFYAANEQVIVDLQPF